MHVPARPTRRQEDEDKLRDKAAKGQVAALIDADRRQARLHGGVKGREASFASATQVTALSSGQSALEGRVKGLEKEIAELKALLMAKGPAAPKH